MKHGFMILVFIFILGSISAYAIVPSTYDNGWVKVSEVQPGVYRIEENNANCYLVLGKEKAVLIDAAYGVSDLQKLCGKITKLPVTVINTHGHYDHVGGSQYFSSVIMHRDDAPMLGKMSSPEMREWFYSTIRNSPNFPKNFDVGNWYASDVKPALLAGGEVLEFGDIKLEVIATPGHTPGSICLLDRQRQLLFTGDTFVPGEMWMQLPESNFNQWVNSAEKISVLRPLVYKVLPGHAIPLDGFALDALGRVVADIRAGKGRVVEVDNPLGGKCLKSQFPSFPFINILHQ